MSIADELLGLVVGALTGATDAGKSVFSPFDWPTEANAYPVIIVTEGDEDMESLGPNAPIYDVTTTFNVLARTKSIAMLGDAGSAIAMAVARKIRRQVIVALINNTNAWVLPNGARRIEQISRVRSNITTSSEGEMPMAELLMHIDIKFTLGTEEFFPIVGTSIDRIAVTVQEPAGTVEPMFSIPAPPFTQS